MDAAENALMQALQSSPEDWSIRLLIADKLTQRGAHDEVAKLIADAPNPPNNPTELEKAATLGGLGALGVAQAYVGENPTDGYGQQIVGHLLQLSGEEEKAAKHFAAAEALGAAAAALPTPQPIQQEPPAPSPVVQQDPPPPSGAQTQSLGAQTQQLGAQTQPLETPAEISQPEITIPELLPPPTFQEPQAQAPPVFHQQGSKHSRPQPGQKQSSSKATAILVAIAVHVVIALIAFYITVLHPPKDEPEIVAAVIGPVSAKREMQKKNIVKQVKKTTSASAAAAPVAQLMRASAMAKFSMPKVTKTSTGPLGMGEGNLGAGGFGGTGSGLGSGATFFGGTSKGNRFLFVLDHSGSMKKHQVELRNKELDRALRSLSGGVQYQVVIFAGAAFYAQNGWSISGSETVKGPGNKTYKFKQKKVTDFDFVGPDSRLPKAPWLAASASNKSRTMSFLRKTKLFYGTDWEMALRVGHFMDPPPDVIFFMSDGTGGNEPKPILSLNKRRGSPVINTVAMQTKSGASQFAAIARGTKGTFTIVDKRGKPINGFDFLKNPGKFNGRL